jgi:DNA-binding transcriptional LysR family regulator
MNLLVALDALLETHSVTAAAERLHLSPPAMSRTLGRLRRVLDDPILVRAGRNLTPTPRAVAMRARVNSIVAEASELLRPSGDVDVAALQRTFTIRGNEQVPAMFAARMLRAIASEAPHVSLRFVPEGDENVEDLRAGRVDLDIGMQHELAPDIVAAELFTDRFVAVVKRGHRLSRGRVTPERLTGESHISMSRRGRARGPLDDALGAVGLTRRIAVIVPTPAAALAVAADTDLVAILPSLAATLSPLAPRLAERPLPVAVPSFTAAMIWHRHLDADPAHQWLRAQVRDAVPDTHHSYRSAAAVPYGPAAPAVPGSERRT